MARGSINFYSKNLERTSMKYFSFFTSFYNLSPKLLPNCILNYIYLFYTTKLKQSSSPKSFGLLLTTTGIWRAGWIWCCITGRDEQARSKRCFTCGTLLCASPGRGPTSSSTKRIFLVSIRVYPSMKTVIFIQPQYCSHVTCFASSWSSANHRSSWRLSLQWLTVRAWRWFLLFATWFVSLSVSSWWPINWRRSSCELYDIWQSQVMLNMVCYGLEKFLPVCFEERLFGSLYDGVGFISAFASKIVVVYRPKHDTSQAVFSNVLCLLPGYVLVIKSHPLIAFVGVRTHDVRVGTFNRPFAGFYILAHL